MNIHRCAIAAALLCAGAAQATCYSVYKADGNLIQEGSTPPVNLSLPLGDTVPEKFGAGALLLVSDHSVYCKDRKGGGELLPNAAAQPETSAVTSIVTQAPGEMKVKEKPAAPVIRQSMAMEAASAMTR